MALSTLGPVAGTVSLDVRLPAVTTWGEVRLVLRLASRGEPYRDLGGVPLAGLTAERFHRLTVAIPADVQAKLADAYTDLSFTIVVNAPSGRYLLDRLHVGQDEPTDSQGDPVPGAPLTITLPPGVNVGDVVLGATNGLGVADRVQLPQAPATLTNAGTIETNVGVDARVGDVIAATPRWAPKWTGWPTTGPCIREPADSRHSRWPTSTTCT